MTEINTVFYETKTMGGILYNYIKPFETVEITFQGAPSDYNYRVNLEKCSYRLKDESKECLFTIIGQEGFFKDKTVGEASLPVIVKSESLNTKLQASYFYFTDITTANNKGAMVYTYLGGKHGEAEILMNCLNFYMSNSLFRDNHYADQPVFRKLNHLKKPKLDEDPSRMFAKLLL
jgi:hypothetical protein